jgi:hypothetical protein
MVDSGLAAQASKMSIQLAGVFTVLGTALLYLYIAISDASNQTKVLWASVLSLVLAVIFLIVWTLAKDIGKQREREPQRKVSP